MDSEFDNLDVDLQDGIAEIKIDRPEKRNAMSPAVLEEMYSALTEFETSAGVIIITGAGEAFCAGLDLEKRFLEPRARGPEAYKEAGKWSAKVWTSLYELDVPTISKINGWTFGGGYELQALCDFSVADEEAQLGLSEINFGMVPGGGTMWAVVNTMPFKKAMYYCATGETFSGREAAEMMAITDAVPGDRLDTRVRQLANNLREKDPVALRFTIDMVRRTRFMTFRESREYERAKAEEMKYYQQEEWAEEGISRFVEGEYKPGLESYKKDES